MRINDRENYTMIRESISMNNLKKIIESKGFTTSKVAINSKISDSTILAYINGQKIPSLPTLISMADYLQCNLDYLVDRTDNPVRPEYLQTLSTSAELNQLFLNIMSLPVEKRNLVIAYVKGILNSD